MKQKSGLPVWIVGTSRGTVSATAMAIKVRDPAIAGLVLTSSVVRYATPGAVAPRPQGHHHAGARLSPCQGRLQALARVSVSYIIKGLSNAHIKKLMVVDGERIRQHDKRWVSTGMASQISSEKQSARLLNGSRTR